MNATLKEERTPPSPALPVLTEKIESMTKEELEMFISRAAQALGLRSA